MNEGRYRWIVIVIILLVLLLPFFTRFSSQSSYQFEKDNSSEVNTEHNQDGPTFVVNLRSKKYHLPSCEYANVKDENDLQTFNDEDFLIKHGYQHCKKCVFWH